MIDHVYFVSCLIGPTYINIIGRKITALIDMPTLKVQTKNIVSVDKGQILEASITVKRVQFKNLRKIGVKRCQNLFT